MDHSSIPPSGLNRVVQCTGSLLFSRDSELPELSNEESEIGTCAHELAANPQYESPLIDDEMREAVKGYVEYCEKVSSSSMVKHVERRVSIPRVHADCWGTLDYGTLVGRTLHVIDLKYGYRHVEVFGHKPMIAYAGGLINEIGNVDKIVLHIYQPRAHHPDGIARTWELTPHELDCELEFISVRVHEALTGGEFKTGVACYKCPRLHDCPAATAASYNAIDVVMSSTASVNGESLQLGRDLIAIENAERVLNDRKSALKEVLQFRIASGKPCPTHTIESKLGNRAWSVSEAEVCAMAQMEGIDDTHNLKLKSPAQLEKAGVDKKTIQGMVKRSQYGKLKPIDFKNIERIFKNE